MIQSDSFTKKFALLLAIFSFILFEQIQAQQKVDRVIPPDESRKVEKARKLFNNFRIYEGEKILKELMKEHPDVCYYAEALIQLQHQVLDNIQVAGKELQEFQAKTIPNSSDSSDNEEENIPVKAPQNTDSIRKANLQRSGLDMGVLDAKEDKAKKKKKEVDQDEIPTLTEAVVTIDSSLLKEPSDEEDGVIKKGLTKEEKELKNKIKALNDLNSIPYDACKNDLVKNAREATRNFPFADSASHYLRMFCVDSLDPDADASEEARDAFQEGMDEYYTRNSGAAAKLFKQAIELYPLYYAARLKLAETYLLMNKDTEAIHIFYEANLIQPNLPNALEKLATDYYKKGKFNDAASNIIEAMFIYPEQNYMQFLQRVLSKTGREFNSQWIKREVYPATTSKNYEEILAPEKTPWWHYQFAKNEVFGYYDTIGLVRPNEKTNERYLEVYTWKQMLNKSGNQYFKFARAMDKLGYLDCYVLFTLFHQDLYGQFHDFAQSHHKKLRDYIYIIINWEDKKFDKVKKEVGLLEVKTTDSKKK